MKTIMLRVSLEGTCLNAARCLCELAEKVREQAGYDPDDPEQTDPAGDADAEIGMLEMIAAHAKGTADGTHDANEFLEFYCLKEKE